MCPLACLLWGPHEHTAPPAWGRHVHLPTSSTPACAHVYVTALEGRAAQLRAGPWAVILSPTWQRPSGQLPQPTGAPRSPPARSAISSGEEGLEAGLPCPGLGSHQPRRSCESLPQPLCPLPGTQASLGLDLCWSVWCSALGLQEHGDYPGVGEPGCRSPFLRAGGFPTHRLSWAPAACSGDCRESPCPCLAFS